MGSIKFTLREEQGAKGPIVREYFEMKVSDLFISEGHVDDDIRKSHPEEYAAFKASLTGDVTSEEAPPVGSTEEDSSVDSPEEVAPIVESEESEDVSVNKEIYS